MDWKLIDNSREESKGKCLENFVYQFLLEDINLIS